MADKPTIKELLERLGDCAVLLNNGDVSKLEAIGYFGELRTAITALEQERDRWKRERDAIWEMHESQGCKNHTGENAWGLAKYLKVFQDRCPMCDYDSLTDCKRVLGELVECHRMIPETDESGVIGWHCPCCGADYDLIGENGYEGGCTNPICPAVEARTLLKPDVVDGHGNTQADLDTAYEGSLKSDEEPEGDAECG